MRVCDVLQKMENAQTNDEGARRRRPAGGDPHLEDSRGQEREQRQVEAMNAGALIRRMFSGLGAVCFCVAMGWASGGTGPSL